MGTLRLTALNVRGRKTKMKRYSTFSVLKKENFDIVALQESHISTNEKAHLWELQWGWKLFYSLSSSHSLGQIILVSKMCMDKTRCIFKDDRILLLETTFGKPKNCYREYLRTTVRIRKKKKSSTRTHKTSLKNTQMMITQLLYSETSIQYSTTTKTSYQVKNTTQGK